MNDQHNETEEIGRDVDHVTEDNTLVSASLSGRPADVAETLGLLIRGAIKPSVFTDDIVDGMAQHIDLTDRLFARAFEIVGIEPIEPGKYSPKALFDRLKELTASKPKRGLTEKEWNQHQDALMADVRAAYAEANQEREKVKTLESELSNTRDVLGIERLKIGELKGEVQHLTQERDDAVHARTELENDLRKAMARIAELQAEISSLEADVANAQRIASTAAAPGSRGALHNARTVSKLCELLDVTPSRILRRVPQLIWAEKRLDLFRGPDGKLPYPTTPAEREAIRKRPFRKRKTEA